MSSVHNKYIYQILNLVEKKSSIGKLINLGIRPKLIINALEQLEKDKYIEQTIDGRKLTIEGKDLLKVLEKKFKESDKSKWISIESKSKISKIDSNFIYLPSLGEID